MAFSGRKEEEDWGVLRGSAYVYGWQRSFIELNFPNYKIAIYFQVYYSIIVDGLDDKMMKEEELYLQHFSHRLEFAIKFLNLFHESLPTQ